MSLRVLQFGATGQLGRALRRAAPAKAFVDILDRAAADFSDPGGCAAAVTAAAPDLVLIAAAYTKVDLAEEETEKARLANVETPGAVAEAAEATGAALAHVSTDYVFDGKKGAPYTEADPTAPLSVYGQTKLDGEQAVLSACKRAIVLRASWVYDAVGESFLRTMLRLGAERETLRIVDDQISAPTPAEDLARVLWAAGQGLAESDSAPRGVRHVQSEPYASWADFADAIFEAAAPHWGRRPAIERITTAEYPTAAQRPLDTRLDGQRLAAELAGLRPSGYAASAAPNWKRDLPSVVAAALAR